MGEPFGLLGSEKKGLVGIPRRPQQKTDPKKTPSGGGVKQKRKRIVSPQLFHFDLRQWRTGRLKRHKNRDNHSKGGSTVGGERRKQTVKKI